MAAVKPERARPRAGGGLLLVALLWPAGGPALAQSPGEVVGRVTYSGNGDGVAGALVALGETGLGVLTEEDGRYRITGAPPGPHRVLTALLGCTLLHRQVEVRAGARTRLDLVLTPPVINLEGLVVTASGRGSELDPFSVTRLDGDREPLASGGSRSLASLVQGRAAGVRVVQGSGAPGSEPSILLRGPTSIQSGQDPLVVVDGVLTRGGVSDIDPLDVMGVVVLKGAAAAAAYGARGQAGVLEITTRRGPRGRGSAPEPLVLVDGQLRESGLAGVDPTEIEDMRRLEGTQAAVLYGTGAEGGVIQVTTRRGPSPGEATLEPVCLDPTR